MDGPNAPASASSDPLRGRVVVVTGASSGLGAATARLLASRGARVVLGARRAERLRALADAIVAAGGEALAVPTDVTRPSEVEALVGAALRAFGRLDVLVNNAGVMPHSPLERARIADWDRTIDVNLKGVLYGIAAALPPMRAQQSGHIVNVSSVAGHKVRAGTAVYAATKHAVRVVSEGLRQEVKPYGIRVSVISPGAVESELPESVTEPDMAEAVRALYRIALPAETFARMVAFVLAEPEEVDVNEILFRPTRQEF